MKINFKKLSLEAKVPVCAHPGKDAGYDLFALDYTTIKPFERKLIKTGIAMEIPEGYYGRIAPRSGLALKQGICVMGGVIDSSYRSDIGVILLNLQCWPFLADIHNSLANLAGVTGEFTIKPGDKIAQIIIEKCHEVDFVEVNELKETERSQGGFGSTGN